MEHLLENSRGYLTLKAAKDQGVDLTANEAFRLVTDAYADGKHRPPSYITFNFLRCYAILYGKENGKSTS